jgi:hypothetical protein
LELKPSASSPTAMNSWQRLRHRHHQKLAKRPPPSVPKGHYHTKGDPVFDKPDMFGD